MLAIMNVLKLEILVQKHVFIIVILFSQSFKSLDVVQLFLEFKHVL
jgi:hypothetical protein